VCPSNQPWMMPLASPAAEFGLSVSKSGVALADDHARDPVVLSGAAHAPTTAETTRTTAFPRRRVRAGRFDIHHLCENLYISLAPSLQSGSRAGRKVRTVYGRRHSTDPLSVTRCAIRADARPVSRILTGQFSFRIPRDCPRAHRFAELTSGLDVEAVV